MSVACGRVLTHGSVRAMRVVTSTEVRGAAVLSIRLLLLSPCRSVGGLPGEPSSFGACVGMLSWHIHDGRADGIDLSGLRAVMSLRCIDRAARGDEILAGLGLELGISSGVSPLAIRVSGQPSVVFRVRENTTLGIAVHGFGGRMGGVPTGRSSLIPARPDAETRHDVGVLGLEMAVALGVALVVCGALARRYPIAPAILLVLVGVLIGFVPHLRQAQLPPEVVLLLFLPVLLYWESLTTSLREIRNNLRVVVLTSTVLVLATAAAVAAAAHAIGLQWGPAWVLGAALAPTDATAVGVLARRLPRRTVTVLRAESLVNDGTALVIYGPRGRGHRRRGGLDAAARERPAGLGLRRRPAHRRADGSGQLAGAPPDGTTRCWRTSRCW